MTAPGNPVEICGGRARLWVRDQQLRALDLQGAPEDFSAGDLQELHTEAARFPLNIERLPPFARLVTRALLNVPAGHTVRYADLAAVAGSPRAARAVGGVCAANLLLVVVPCHRVVAGNDGLGGFRLGLVWKRRLLDLERR